MIIKIEIKDKAVFKVFLSKKYEKTGKVIGSIKVMADSPERAKEIVNEAMASDRTSKSSVRCLQTIDPRIKWENRANRDNNGDYVDFSFKVESVFEERILSAKIEDILLSATDICIDDRNFNIV